MLLQASAFGGVFTGFAIARDFESGFGRRLMLAAPNRSRSSRATRSAALVRAVFVWVAAHAVALLAGCRSAAARRRPRRAATGSRCSSTSRRCMWSAGIALRFRSIQAGPLMQTPVFLILFLAPVYVPLDLLSGWVHAVGEREPAHRDGRGGPRT